MTSSRPYLIRALYEWITDNGLTPHLVADALGNVQVPPGVVENDKVTLNIAPTAVESLELGNNWVNFHARFSGESHHVMLPVAAVLAIYARENGQGMMFPPEEDVATRPKADGDGDRKRPHLKVIK